MDCCLWLNRKKISSAAEIIDSFDLAAVRGYFLGGSLSEWLREHNGEAYADILDQIDPSDEMLNDKLCRAFGITPSAVPEVFCGNSGVTAAYQGGSFTGSYHAGSGLAGSFGGSGLAASYSYGSFGSFGSYAGHGSYSGSGSFYGYGSGFGLLGSYRFSLWEWEWEWRFGRRGSFSLGSFGSVGSYRFGAGSYLLGAFGSFRGGSFPGLYGSFGSFCAGSFGGVAADEYDRIMYECLRKCPLNCYGYGIHII